MKDFIKVISHLSSKKNTLYPQPIPEAMRVVTCDNKEDAKKVMNFYGHILSHIICLKDDHTWAIANNCNDIEEIYGTSEHSKQ